MTPQIASVLIILGVAVVLFISDKVPMEIVGLSVMVILGVTGLVTPAEAVSGFSNPAVITVWAVMILSAGLSRTGVANIIGDRLMTITGQSETKVILVIMLTSGILSGIMNNIGVVSLMLPVVIEVGRKTKIPSYKLLIPLAFSSLLGGLTTLIGTPPNILISQALSAADLEPFRMFDFFPTGIIFLLVGILFITFFGRKLIIRKEPASDKSERDQTEYEEFFSLKERLFAITIPKDSSISGKTLAQSRLGAILGINVIAIIRNGKTQLAPTPITLLNPGDRLVVSGRSDKIKEFIGKQQLVVEDTDLSTEWLRSDEVEFAEVVLSPRSKYLGKSLEQIGFRQNFGVNVLAIWRDGIPKRTNLQDLKLEIGDMLLVQGQRHRLQNIEDDSNFLISGSNQVEIYDLHERLLAVKIPLESNLAGKSLEESRLGEAYGFTVLGIIRDGASQLMPATGEILKVDDILLIEGRPEDLDTLRSIQELVLDPSVQLNMQQLESESIGFTEVVVSPHASLAGKTLRRIHFREKYGLSVLAIWREGRAYRSSLSDLPLRYGDSLLVFGLRERLKILGTDPEFLVLSPDVQEVPRRNKMWLALLIMSLVLLSVIFNLIPIAIATVAGAVLMIVTGCLMPEEAYRNISWKAVFLIAGMLPLGIAMETSGTANFLADKMIALVGHLGPIAVTAGIYLLAAIVFQVIPNAAVAVLLSPVALNAASALNISPYPLMMTLAMAASAAFLSPVSHPVNVMVMGPGGYRFSDFAKVGIPLTLVLLVVALLIIPIFWPF